MTIRVERNAGATMRDGTVLRADLYRPEGEGPFPVLVNRTPYDKDGKESLGQKLAECGYLFVCQDVRYRRYPHGA